MYCICIYTKYISYTCAVTYLPLLYYTSIHLYLQLACLLFFFNQEGVLKFKENVSILAKNDKFLALSSIGQVTF